MTIDDYDHVFQLWSSIDGFGIRSIDDSKEGVHKFLLRNPELSIVATQDKHIIGTVLCGHDGRRGCLYHVCVDPMFRRQGVGKTMVIQAMQALQKEGINKVALIAFTKNDVGNSFWNTIGWLQRTDLNYYEFSLNDENITRFIHA